MGAKVFNMKYSYYDVFVYIMLLFKLGSFSACFTDSVSDKKQTIRTNKRKISHLQAKVEELEASSTEKNTLIATLQAIVKENEG